VHEDGQLIGQIRKGDLRAFETLYHKYKSQVYRTALAITSDPGAAEDILQDCFLRVHANIDRLDGSVPISPWLHRVTVNLAYNYVAKRKRRAGPLDLVIETLAAGTQALPDRHLETTELRDSVQAAIDSLSFSQRVVVTLFYLSEFSLEEIAYILDCPVGTVKSRLHYARNKLRSQLTAEFEVGAQATV
jgi:RNA polymerase sigma-70 factor (ECF subfamily)